ncbi:MAG: hypothetical protein QM638_08675 [Nocardioides sp.]|uniref:hypothetical protein n=1 Tax=Nocardioides sp. TaxID=35761 RepID=UPI0039E2DD45
MKNRPLPLLVAVVLVAVEAVLLLVWAVLEFASLDDSEIGGSAAAVGIFFLVCGAGLGFCAWSLGGLHSWARAPIVLTQLIVLGLSWNARHSSALLSVGLFVLAVLGLVGIFHPASLDALSPDEEE